jgi:hypothetical protein
LVMSTLTLATVKYVYCPAEGFVWGGVCIPGTVQGTRELTVISLAELSPLISIVLLFAALILVMPALSLLGRSYGRTVRGMTYAVGGILSIILLADFAISWRKLFFGPARGGYLIRGPALLSGSEQLILNVTAPPSHYGCCIHIRCRRGSGMAQATSFPV